MRFPLLLLLLASAAYGQTNVSKILEQGMKGAAAALTPVPDAEKREVLTATATLLSKHVTTLTWHRLVAPLEDVPAALAATVPGLTEPTEQRLHAGDEIRLGSFDQEMEVVPHQHPRMNPPAVAAADLAELVEEIEAVFVVLKNHLSPSPRAMT